MGKTIWHCHIAMSLDGKIARADGSFDWLESYPPQEFGFGALMASIDAILMGRDTYEVIRGMIAAGKLDILEMAIVPIVLGDGIPLIAPGTPELNLTLKSCEPRSGGALHVCYEVITTWRAGESK